jgi:Fur family peroxide stress response transcriptional regulator
MSAKERKHSRKRDEILEVIRATTSHPSAQWVYNELKPRIPDLSLGTVYRNITQFREEGSVVSLGVVDGEEHFDGDVRPHPHFVCCRCGRIMDLPDPERYVALAKAVGNVSGDSGGGLVIDYQKTVFRGLCADCRG